MNRRLILSIALLTPAAVHADMGRGAEGFFIMLANNFLLAFTFVITMMLAALKLFSTAMRRNIFIGLNTIPLLITLYGLFLFLREQPELDTGWLVIPTMFLIHLLSLLIPHAQYKMLNKTNA